MINYKFTNEKEKKELEQVILLFEDHYMLKSKGKSEVCAVKTDYNIHIYPERDSSIEEIISKHPNNTSLIKSSSSEIFIRIKNQIYKISYKPVTA